MYKSKLGKYKKILLAVFFVYCICLPFICFFTEKWLQFCFLFGAVSVVLTWYINFTTVVRQDKYIEKNLKGLYDTFKNDWRRPLNISFILLVNRKKEPGTEKLLKKTKSLIFLNISVFSALFAGLMTAVFIKAFVSLL